MYICCTGLGSWARCLVDNLNHFLLRRFYVKRVCDAHDSYLMKEWDRD